MVEIKHGWAAFAVVFGLSGCGQGGHPGESAGGPAADPRSAAPAPASVSAAAPSPPPAASASVAVPLATASAAVAVAAPEPAVVEVHSPAIHKKLSLSASGKVTLERSFEVEPDEIRTGQVPAERVEALHKVLTGAGFCALAPKQRESSPGYIIIQARFPDVSCSVELPDKRWDTDVKARKVMEAVRKVEQEACPRGCKPGDSPPP